MLPVTADVSGCTACVIEHLDNRKHEKKPPTVTGLDIAVLDTWAAQQQGKGSPLEGVGAFGAGLSNCTATVCCSANLLCSVVICLQVASVHAVLFCQMNVCQWVRSHWVHGDIVELYKVS